jgi:hypothetical protein
MARVLLHQAAVRVRRLPICHQLRAHAKGVKLNKVMNSKPILTAIKAGLRLGGELPQAQRHYLIDAFSRHNTGQPLEPDSNQSDDQHPN